MASSIGLKLRSMAPGQPSTSVSMNLQLMDAGGDLSFPSVANSPVTVTSNAWVRIKAKPYTVSGAYTNLQPYLQTNNGTGSATASFFIDDVKVQFMPPPVIENIRRSREPNSGNFPVGLAALQQANDNEGPNDAANLTFTYSVPATTQWTETGGSCLPATVV